MTLVCLSTRLPVCGLGSSLGESLDGCMLQAGHILAVMRGNA